MGRFRIFGRQSVIGKLLLSYGVLLFLPISLIWTYLFPQTQQRMLDNALFAQQNNSARLSAVLEQHLTSVVTSAVGVASNPQLKPYALQKSVIGGYEAIREMRKHFYSNGFFSQTFFHLRANDRFYTSTASYPLSWLCNTGFGYCYYDWPETDMEKILRENKTLLVRPLERVAYPDHRASQVITLILPVPMDGTPPYGSLLFWIDESTLFKLIEPVGSKKHETTLLYDADGQRVFSMYADQIAMPMDDLDALLLSQSINTALQLTIGHEQYIYASSSQGNTSWRVVSLMPLSTLMEDINAMRWNLILIIALLVGMSFVIIAIAVRSHYAPIRTLVSQAGQYVTPEGRTNEFAVVQHALEHLNTRAVTLQTRAAENIPMLREYWLYELIAGRYQTTADFNEAAAQEDLQLTLPVLCVTAIRLSTQEPIDALEYLQRMEDGLPRGLEGYYLIAFNRRDILFISASQSPQAVKVYITDTVADLAVTQRCKVQAAMGNPVQKAKDMASSYNEAVDCLERMALMGRFGVEQYADSDAHDTLSQVAQLFPMDFAIAKLDTEQINQSVSDLLSYIHTGTPSKLLVHAMYLNAMALLLRGLEAYDVDTTQFMQATKVPENARYDEIERNLHRLTDMLCNCINREQKDASISIEEVNQYICENALAYEFSIQRAAEHFHMSFTGFSHFYKRKMGIACKQFVDEYRAEKAIEQLMHTMDPLEVIAQNVGFANVSGFIRSFKKVTGRTPGSYRNM